MTINTSKRWFHLPGKAGDRSLKEQMIGLNEALALAKGKTVLDLGCAEALISLEFAKAGAKEVIAVEALSYHLDVARGICEGQPVRFVQEYVENLATQPHGSWDADIVLALAILHKLRDVESGLEFVARSARELVVFRFPQWFSPKGWLRSKRHPGEVHVPTVMTKHGFSMIRNISGPRGEPVQYWSRA